MEVYCAMYSNTLEEIMQKVKIEFNNYEDNVDKRVKNIIKKIKKTKNKKNKREVMESWNISQPAIMTCIFLLQLKLLKLWLTSQPLLKRQNIHFSYDEKNTVRM